MTYIDVIIIETIDSENTMQDKKLHTGIKKMQFKDPGI